MFLNKLLSGMQLGWIWLCLQPSGDIQAKLNLLLHCHPTMGWDVLTFSSGMLNVTEVQPTESDRINLSISLRKSRSNPLPRPGQGIKLRHSVTILSDLHRINLAQSLRQVVCI
ncbi:hypothetical protein ATANTOWER_012939 [Ataeniobius toweri]|uniref:Uncharacterized protein n=1 Tax=Ataeniobius toweri TaxID=208326 RepID=A0ABU7CC26_9TELE|nr:hypothetical protein [Ataeniobius toweri]